MHTLARTWIALSATFLPITVAHAQEHLRGGFVIPRLAGLHELDGALWGVGPDYKAVFRAEGVELTPALGSRAPRNYPFGLRLAAVGRGDDLQPAGPVEPRQRDMQVRYERGLCSERYDVGVDGIAQSFVFAQLPAGRGDLVVQLAVATDLPLAQADANGLRFELPGLGGVCVGAVTGVDARGRHQVGTITGDGRAIELRLPAAFVDEAVLPLVLDPQIGPVLPIAVASFDYQNPDIARLQGQTESLCVFERQISATDRDLRALRLNHNGGTIGTLVPLTTGTGDDHAPAAGSIAANNVYVIAYERGGDVFARALLPGGSPSGEITVASGADNQVAPDLGSEATLVDDDCVVVWHNSSQTKIQGAQLFFTASNSLTVFGQADLAAALSGTYTLGRPRIAHDGGTTGRFMVVYPRTLLAGDTKARAIVIDRNLTVLATAPVTSSTDDEDNVDVDGDGTTWVVVFESEANEGTGDNSIVAVPIYWRDSVGQLWVTSPRTVTNLVNVDEINPAVAMMDQSSVVAWRRRAGPGSSNTEVFMKTIDNLACAECEPTVLLANTSAIETNLAMDATLLGALVLWEADVAGNGDLYGVAWQAEDGTAQPGFGGCGGGVAVAGCARVGNPNCYLELRDGPSGQFLSYLVLSADTTHINCGPCTLVADPFAGYVSSMVASVDGLSAYSLAIPNNSALSGMSFEMQWIVSAGAAGQCSFLNANFSNSLRVWVE